MWLEHPSLSYSVMVQTQEGWSCLQGRNSCLSSPLCTNLAETLYLLPDSLFQMRFCSQGLWTLVSLSLHDGLLL